MKSLLWEQKCPSSLEAKDISEWQSFQSTHRTSQGNWLYVPREIKEECLISLKLQELIRISFVGKGDHFRGAKPRISFREK